MHKNPRGSTVFKVFHIDEFNITLYINISAGYHNFLTNSNKRARLMQTDFFRGLISLPSEPHRAFYH